MTDNESSTNYKMVKKVADGTQAAMKEMVLGNKSHKKALQRKNKRNNTPQPPNKKNVIPIMRETEE